jgi:hypothetical protein
MSALPVPRRLDVLVEEIHEEVRLAEHHWNQALRHAITAGEKLIEAKTLVRHGEWLPWLEANFPGGRSTAQLYMQLARNAQRVGHLASVREAMAALTEPRAEALAASEPSVVFEVLRLFERGELGAEILNVDPDWRPEIDHLPTPGDEPRARILPQPDPIHGLFTWMVPWVARCPCCGTVEVRPRPIDAEAER